MTRASMAHIEVRPESIKRNELIVDPSRLFRRKLKHREGPRWERPEWPSKGLSWRLQGAFFHFSKFKREDFCCQGEEWLRINVCHSMPVLSPNSNLTRFLQERERMKIMRQCSWLQHKHSRPLHAVVGRRKSILIYSTKRQWAAAYGRLALDPWWVWDPYHSHHGIARKFSKL